SRTRNTASAWSPWGARCTPTPGTTTWLVSPNFPQWTGKCWPSRTTRYVNANRRSSAPSGAHSFAPTTASTDREVRCVAAYTRLRNAPQLLSLAEEPSAGVPTPERVDLVGGRGGELADRRRDGQLPAARRPGRGDAVFDRVVARGHRGEHELVGAVELLERPEVGHERAHRPPRRRDVA